VDGEIAPVEEPPGQRQEEVSQGVTLDIQDDQSSTGEAEKFAH